MTQLHLKWYHKLPAWLAFKLVLLMYRKDIKEYEKE